MLQPSLIEYDHDILLKYFTTVFAEKYDVACQSALHHNKTKTNLHIHLIFSERKALEEPERKIAKRNIDVMKLTKAELRELLIQRMIDDLYV